MLLSLRQGRGGDNMNIRRLKEFEPLKHGDICIETKGNIRYVYLFYIENNKRYLYSFKNNLRVRWNNYKVDNDDWYRREEGA